jgi:arginyl-tRNA synthetase
MNLLSELREVFRPVLQGFAPDPTKLDDYLAMVKPAQNPEHGDYQANFAMPLAKLLKRKPQELAAEVVQNLPANDLIAASSVAGPGFINVRLNDAWLARQVQAMAGDARLGVAAPAVPKTFVIDYSGPNVAKPLHVGHLRSTIIGEALCRLLRFLGHQVIGDNHLGDWGAQFGMLLYGFKNFRNKKEFEKEPVRELARLYIEVRKLAETFGLLQLGYEKYRDPQAFDKDPIAELARLYVRSLERKRNKADDEDDDDEPSANPIANAYRNETVKLHAGDPENLALWRQFMPACMAEVEAIYRRLEVKFDYQHGESFYNAMLPDVVKDLRQRGVAEESQGAIVIRYDGNKIALIQKSDGAFTYSTTDLATIKYRCDTWQPDAILYVVDFRQADHFKGLFATAKNWGFDQVELTHVSHGSVLDEKTRKPLKTREGGSTELESLLDRAIQLGSEKYQQNCVERLLRKQEVPELSDDERRQIAEAVGIGAVKYADLSQNRTSDYAFSFEKMLATDGNTATYMQYAYARCRSILRKGEVDEQRFRTGPPPVIIEEPEERAICLELLRFGDALEAAATDYAPHLLTGYLWDLTKAMSSFYAADRCAVLKAATPELRDSRLLLCDLTARVIRQTLELLGIRTVERM